MFHDSVEMQLKLSLKVIEIDRNRVIKTILAWCYQEPDNDIEKLILSSISYLKLVRLPGLISINTCIGLYYSGKTYY